MIKVKIVKPEPGYKVGDTYDVSNNIAHGLIEQGIAKPYKAKQAVSYKNKMMTPSKSPKKKSKKSSYKVK